MKKGVKLSRNSSSINHKKLKTHKSCKLKVNATVSMKTSQKLQPDTLSSHRVRAGTISSFQNSCNQKTVIISATLSPKDKLFPPDWIQSNNLGTLHNQTLAKYDYLSSKLKAEVRQEKAAELGESGASLMREELRSKHRRIKELESDKETLAVENARLKRRMQILEDTVEAIARSENPQNKNLLKEISNTTRSENYNKARREAYNSASVKVDSVYKPEGSQGAGYSTGSNSELKIIESRIEQLRLENVKLQAKCEELEDANRKLQHKLNEQEEAQLLIAIEKQKVHQQLMLL
eukprot:TRINITY_DN9937_c0_g2_i16.p1 TRINITY_DN9937_c0_g2~~TRINITY_DN9937_c0_g2_i16.p1  ORF type:complete len:292 (-),score=67.92 TRINITY_DN9937_c0_g2_i16:93-968(-)